MRPLGGLPDHYQSCKAAYNQAVGLPPTTGVNCNSEFKSWAEQTCNFTDAGAPAHSLAELHNASLTIALWFQANGLEPQWLVKEVALSLLKYGTPLPEDVEENARFRNVLALTNAAKSKRMLSSLKCPMGGSLVYVKPQKKRKSIGDDAPAGGDEADAAAKKGKRTSKGGKQPKAPKFEEKLDAKTQKGEREKMLLDDLFTCILAHLQPLPTQLWNEKAIVCIMQHGLRFALTGEITLNGKELKFRLQSQQMRP